MKDGGKRLRTKNYFKMKFLTLIGILFFPIFTLGCVLIHYHHPYLGIIAIIVSILTDTNKEKN